VSTGRHFAHSLVFIVYDRDDPGDPFNLDQPYTNADLRKPGFDPFEAHRAWIARKKLGLSLAEREQRRTAAITRTRAAIAKCAEEEKHPKRKRWRPPKLQLVKSSKSTLNEWKEALADVERRKRETP
jgi:hypothetical protein